MVWQPKHLTREQMAERRAEGVKLLQAGKMTQAQLARYLSVSEATVSQWERKLDQAGPEALQPRTASGRPPKLDTAARQMLVKKLEAGAMAAGFPSEQWTQARVKQV